MEKLAQEKDKSKKDVIEEIAYIMYPEWDTQTEDEIRQKAMLFDILSYNFETGEELIDTVIKVSDNVEELFDNIKISMQRACQRDREKLERLEKILIELKKL